MKELKIEGFGYDGWCWYNPYKYVKSILQQYDKLPKEDKIREKDNFVKDLNKVFLEQLKDIKEKCLENGFQDRLLFLYVNMFRVIHSFISEITWKIYYDDDKEYFYEIEDKNKIDWFDDDDLDSNGFFPDYLYFIQTRFERLFFNKEIEDDEELSMFEYDVEQWERDKFDDDGNIEETFLKNRENILKDNLDKLKLEKKIG